MELHEYCELGCHAAEHKGYCNCAELSGTCELLRDARPDEMDIARDAAIRKSEEKS